jgi:HK97 gp10 family phage protein
MPMKFTMTGFDEVQGEMKLMRNAVQRDAARKAARAGATVILDAIVESTPVLDAKTAASTALAPEALKTDMNIKTKTDKLGFLQMWIGPHLHWNVSYWVEYGHFIVKGGFLSMKRGKLQGQGKRFGEVEPHAFIRPAYERSAGPAMAAFTETMKRQLQKWLS